MIRNLIPLFLICLFSSALMAQINASTDPARERDQTPTPAVAHLNQETVEVQYFFQQLANLKAAFAAKDNGKIAVYESAVLMGLRNEINQLELKLATESAQAERRKLATSGQINQAATAEEAPKRDPFAEATTPDEIRFEALQYTLAAFDRHSFDPSKPDDAARDFEKLDKVQKIMEEVLAELRARLPLTPSKGG